MSTKKIFSTLIRLVLAWLLSTGAVFSQSINNPYYDDPAWKLWYEDDSPVVDPLGVTLKPPPIDIRRYLDDAPAGNPDLFLEYRDTDWPDRPYAGFWNDVYTSWGHPTTDIYHSQMPHEWVGEYGNEIDLYSSYTVRPYMRHAIPININVENLQEWGTSWTSSSSPGQNHFIANIESNIQILEREFYFANAFRASPAQVSYRELYPLYSEDYYHALVPSLYNSIGSSTSEEAAVGKMMIASGYLPRTLKPALLRHGLLQTAMFYIWKQGLPYQVPYDHELRHRVAYSSNGDFSEQNYPGSQNNDSGQVGEAAFNYDPTRHLGNMVALAKSMKIPPPIALLTRIDEPAISKTAILTQQPAVDPAQLRVSTVESYDLLGLPLTFRWKVLYGNKNTTVVKDTSFLHDGEPTYLITVPDDPALPRGRTVIALIANNGFFDSNIATVNVYRPGETPDINGPGDEDEHNTRVRPVTGLEDRTILPGETVSMAMHSRDAEGFPVSYAKWDGVGELDGNVFNWTSDSAQEEGFYPVTVAASDGTAGNGYNGGSARIEVSNTVAELSADVTIGDAPMTVNFSSAGSRDRDGNTLTYVWDFDDGSNGSTDENPTHVFTTPGFYEVSLTVDGPLLDPHTATQVIEVRHAWPLVLNNGWDRESRVVDTANVWDANGTIEVITTSAGTRLTLQGGDLDAPVSMTTKWGFTPPLYLEAVFQRPSWAKKERQAGFQLLGSLLGNPGNDPEYYSEFDYSIGHPSATDGNWDCRSDGTVSDTCKPVGRHLRSPRVASTLRLYIEPDPNQPPGKIRYRGHLDTDLGRFWIKLDNQDPTESWYSDRLGFTSEIGSAFNVWRYQVWVEEPDDITVPDEVSMPSLGPEIHVTDAESNSLEDPLPGSKDEKEKDAIVVRNATEFGSPPVAGGNVTRTYTIHNAGDENLVLDNPAVTITGTEASDYTVTAHPTSPVSAGASTNFTVTFTPSGPGLRLATIEIDSNDPDESTLEFDVRGWDLTAAEINIEGNGLNIASGASSVTSTDHTDFGTVSQSSSLEREYVIQNHGWDTLNINSVDISGTHSSDFTVTQSPRPILNGLESSTLKIRFIPSDLGIRSATVTVNSNYSFAIQGTGVDAVVLDQSTLDVPEGDTALLGVKLSNPPAAPLTVTVTAMNGAHLDDDISVQSGASLNFDGSNWSSYQEVELAAAEDEFDTVGGIGLLRLSTGTTQFPDKFFVVMEDDNDQNSKPKAIPQEDVTAVQGCGLHITLAGDDRDTGASFSYNITQDPQFGDLTGTAPDLIYTSDPEHLGSDSFDYTVNDGHVDSDPATVSITVVAADPADKVTDSDEDGLTDWDETCIYFTDPFNSIDGYADTDGDGYINFVEFAQGTDATDINSFPVLPTLHVDRNATGGGDGSQGAPYTFDEAVANAKAGDTIYLQPGNYEITNDTQIPLLVDLVGVDRYRVYVAIRSEVDDLPGIHLQSNYSNITLFAHEDFYDPSFLIITTSGYAPVSIRSSTIYAETRWKPKPNAPVLFENNIVWGWDFTTGMIFIQDDHADFEVKNNTFYNHAISINNAPDSAEFRNNIFDSTTGIGSTDPGAVFRYNLFTDPDYSETLELLDSSNKIGNFDTADIGFVDVANYNLHLNWDSPAVDTGDPGDPFDNEPEPNGDRINIGAYGNTSEAATMPDTDGDGLSDTEEAVLGTNPNLADTDSDDLDDFTEVNVTGTDPNLADTDSDGLTDADEVALGTDPNDSIDGYADTDGDGYINFVEFAQGTDATDINSFPVLPTLHVDSNATGGGDGSQGLPYTFAEAVANAVAGDTILLQAGNYEITNSTKVPLLVDLAGVDRDLVFIAIKSTMGVFGYELPALYLRSNYSNISIWPHEHSDLIIETAGNAPVSFSSSTIYGGTTWEPKPNAPVLFENNIVWGSETTTGVLFVPGNHADFEVKNNTFYTHATGVNNAPDSAEFRNNIFDVATGIGSADPDAVFGYNLFTDPSWSTTPDADGNFGAADIGFVDVANYNLHLNWDSPAVDTGDPGDSFDNEPEPNGDRINIGAYGNTSEAATSSP